MTSTPIRRLTGALALIAVLGVGAAGQAAPQYFVGSGKLTAAGKVLVEPGMVLNVNQPGSVAVTDGQGNLSWRVVMTVTNSAQSDSLSWHTRLLEMVEGSWQVRLERILTFDPQERPTFRGKSDSAQYDAALGYEFTLEPHVGEQPPAPPGFEG